MITPVETAKPTDLLKDALKKMVKKNIGSVVVVDGEKLVGIITERDISRKVVKGTNSLRIRLKRVMSSPVTVVSPSTTNQEALETMLRHGIRRLPVIADGKLVGIVTERNLLRWVVQISYEPHVPPEIKEILGRPPLAKT